MQKFLGTTKGAYSGVSTCSPPYLIPRDEIDEVCDGTKEERLYSGLQSLKRETSSFSGFKYMCFKGQGTVKMMVIRPCYLLEVDPVSTEQLRNRYCQSSVASRDATKKNSYPHIRLHSSLWHEGRGPDDLKMGIHLMLPSVESLLPNHQLGDPKDVITRYSLHQFPSMKLVGPDTECKVKMPVNRSQVPAHLGDEFLLYFLVLRQNDEVPVAWTVSNPFRLCGKIHQFKDDNNSRERVRRHTKIKKNEKYMSGVMRALQMNNKTPTSKDDRSSEEERAPPSESSQVPPPPQPPQSPFYDAQSTDINQSTNITPSTRMNQFISNVQPYSRNVEAFSFDAFQPNNSPFMPTPTFSTNYTSPIFQDDRGLRQVPDHQTPMQSFDPIPPLYLASTTTTHVSNLRWSNDIWDQEGMRRMERQPESSQTMHNIYPIYQKPYGEEERGSFIKRESDDLGQNPLIADVVRRQQLEQMQQLYRTNQQQQQMRQRERKGID
ncbi:hypothetical protein PROFUN_10380 [Planoprotostelium fungivorum]|uniref:Uncharacterized protein n=1 Tax=Planoprotostelium fungivorum TaxID=1890364 RepID=A0A2P6NEC6_9EUKA|nr:hypothetical protein PROFUN_10380 [Planoprotostelium fungivorum]